MLSIIHISHALADKLGLDYLAFIEICDVKVKLAIFLFGLQKPLAVPALSFRLSLGSFWFLFIFFALFS
jgi:hypothetical protein